MTRLASWRPVPKLDVFSCAVEHEGALIRPLVSWTEATVDSPICSISDPETPGGCSYSIDSALAVDVVRRSAESP